MTDHTERLQALADRLELNELIARGPRCIDERRWDDFADHFTDDVHATTPGGAVEGVRALVELARTAHADCESTFHAPSSAVIDLDGDTAQIRSLANVVFTYRDGTFSHLTARYRHEARRTAEGWKISKMEIFPNARTKPLEPAR